MTYTAIMVQTQFVKAGAREEYYLARRDLTEHAACSSPVSTAPDGPTTTFTLGASIAARCFRVSATKTDKLLFAFRNSAPTDPSTFDTPAAAMIVTNNSGTVICAWLLYCPATGSTSYQAIALTIDYTDVASTAQLDSWLVATSAGWAPACQRHSYSTDATSAAVSATLTDSSDVYCAVVDEEPNQQLSIYGSDNAIAPSTLWVNAYTEASWQSPEGSPGGCAFGLDWCDFLPVQQASQALLIVTPYDHSQNPISFDLQAVCRLGCAVQRPVPVYKSISPAAQAAGPDNTVVLTGTGLSFGTEFYLMAQSGAEAYSQPAPVSVNAAGTRLTLRLDTTNVPPGTYDVSAGDFCSPSPCSDWLLKAYTIKKGPTAPPGTRFVPVAAKRVLDTRTGLGVQRASVPAHGTITFQVAGHAGVPTGKVAAAVLDVSAVTPARAGFLTVFPAGQPRPLAHTTDFAAGRSATGLVTVPVVNGRVAVYNGSPGAIDLTGDILGYDTTASAGLRFTSAGPDRILNSARVGAAHAYPLTVAGAGGISAHGTDAVALDVSVTDPAKAGRVIAYPDGAKRPGVTSVSFAAGQSVTELVVARVTDGKVDLYNTSAGSLRLTVDSVGYYSAAGSTFHPVRAVRVLDTRTGFGGAGSAILPHAAALLSPLWPTVLPGDVSAVALNVTVLRPSSAGALTVFPDGVLYQDGLALPNSTSLPGTPNLTFLAGQDQSTLVIVPTSALADFYNGSDGKLGVVADLEGYYTS